MFARAPKPQLPRDEELTFQEWWNLKLLATLLIPNFHWGIFMDVMASCSQHSCWREGALGLKAMLIEPQLRVDCHQLPLQAVCGHCGAMKHTWPVMLRTRPWRAWDDCQSLTESESNYKFPLQSNTTSKHSGNACLRAWHVKKESKYFIESMGMKHRQNLVTLLPGSQNEQRNCAARKVLLPGYNLGSSGNFQTCVKNRMYHAQEPTLREEPGSLLGLFNYRHSWSLTANSVSVALVCPLSVKRGVGHSQLSSPTLEELLLSVQQQ